MDGQTTMQVVISWSQLKKVQKGIITQSISSVYSWTQSLALLHKICVVKKLDGWDILSQFYFQNTEQLQEFYRKLHESGLEAVIVDEIPRQSEIVTLQFKNQENLLELLSSQNRQKLNESINRWQSSMKKSQEKHVPKSQVQQLKEIDRMKSTHRGKSDITHQIPASSFQQDMLFFSPQWSSARQTLRLILRNWSTFQKSALDKTMRFVRENEYHIFKTGRKKQWKNNQRVSVHHESMFGQFEARSWVMELLYEEISSLVFDFIVKTGQQTIFEEYQQYKSTQRNTNKEENTIQKQFLEKFRSVHLGGQNPHLANQLLCYYLQDMNNKQVKGDEGTLSLKLENKMIPLSHYIAECTHFNRSSSRWADAFEAIQHDFKANKDYYSQKFTLSGKFLQQIEQQKITSMGCLGCSTFFYQGINLYDVGINDIPLKVFNSVVKIVEDQGQVKDWIVCMLNSGGGVILFDCYQEYRRIIPRGVHITESLKNDYEQRIKSYLEDLNLKPVECKIVVNFVPLKYCPFEFQLDRRQTEQYVGYQRILKPQQQFQIRPFIEGKYVTRIVVGPLNPIKLYYWRTEPHQTFPVCRQGVKVAMQAKEISRAIKTKYRNHYHPQIHGFSQVFTMFSVRSSLFDHTCQTPQLGIAIKEIPNSATVSQSGSCPEDKYGYASLMVVPRQYLNKVMCRLSQLQVDCFIQTPFDNYRFRQASKSAIIHHNIQFQELMAMVCYQSDFTYEGRQVILISITTYLKIETQTFRGEEDFTTLSQWLHQQFPNQTLEGYQFINALGQKELYLKTDSHRSTAFIYYVMNHFKSAVMFKNPEKIDKMTEEQRNARFVNIYPPKLQSSYVEPNSVSEGSVLRPNQHLQKVKQSLIEDQHDEKLNEQDFDNFFKQGRALLIPWIRFNCDEVTSLVQGINDILINW